LIARERKGKKTGGRAFGESLRGREGGRKRGRERDEWIKKEGNEMRGSKVERQERTVV